VKAVEQGHIGIVVKNIDDAMKMYSNMGLGPWKIFKAGDMTDTYVRGSPQYFSLKCAIAPLGPIGLELIQPVEGRDLCKEFLDLRGGGFHHVLIYVDDLPSAVKEFERFGIRVVQSGKDSGVNPWVYLDTESAFGLPALEIAERPRH
jgi:hypothetical protein